LPAGAADAMAPWAVHTHCVDLFRHTVRLLFTSPQPECGKTTALEALALVCCKSLPTSNVTAAALFRTVEARHPTLLIDEGDTFLVGADDLRGILNAGHKRGGQVLRCVGDDSEPRAFPVFGPAALAAIGRLADTIQGRSIKVLMKRATRTEEPKPLGPAAEREAAELASQCARWVADNTDTLRDADPALPGSLFNRSADNWRPLFAIAQAAGGDWSERLAKSVAVLAQGESDTEGRGIRLLADVRSVFDEQRTKLAAEVANKIASEHLCSVLTADATGPWAEYKGGKPLSQTQLANIVKPFGIRPHSVRIGTGTPKGYERDDFEEAWQRYLPGRGPSSSGNGAAEPQHRNNVDGDCIFAENQSATPANVLRPENSESCSPEQQCCGVAAPQPPPREEWRAEI
jgi:hypothetical protein